MGQIFAKCPTFYYVVVSAKNLPIFPTAYPAPSFLHLACLKKAATIDFDSVLRPAAELRTFSRQFGSRLPPANAQINACKLCHFRRLCSAGGVAPRPLISISKICTNLEIGAENTSENFTCAAVLDCRRYCCRYGPETNAKTTAATAQFIAPKLMFICPHLHRRHRRRNRRLHRYFCYRDLGSQTHQSAVFCLKNVTDE